MYHAASKHLRSQLLIKKTEILTQISVFNQEIAEMKLSRIEESNFKEKLHSLKINEKINEKSCCYSLSVLAGRTAIQLRRHNRR